MTYSQLEARVSANKTNFNLPSCKRLDGYLCFYLTNFTVRFAYEFRTDPSNCNN